MPRPVVQETGLWLSVIGVKQEQVALKNAKYCFLVLSTSSSENTKKTQKNSSKVRAVKTSSSIVIALIKKEVFVKDMQEPTASLRKLTFCIRS